MLKYLENNHDDQIPSNVLDTAVSEIVKKQIDVGVTVVGDGRLFHEFIHKQNLTIIGEMSKPSYVSYVTSRLTGFDGSDTGPGVADLADYPGFAKQQVSSDHERYLHVFIFL